MEALPPNGPIAGRYVLLEPIATGGMAIVWRARDDVLARTVAVKILRDDLAGDAGLSERFRREAVAAARLTHPNIVSVFDAGENGSQSYIVMEHFEGTTLGELMHEKGPLSPTRAIAIATPVLAALSFAHGHGIVHRDVKPGNILVGTEDRVKIADFGIAHAAFRDGGDAEALTTTSAMLGTVRYLSPEQVDGREVDGRSDIYSLGVTLYEMLTGRPPFEAETDVATAMMRLTTDPLPLRAVRPEIPRDLEAIVLRAMARQPDDRYPDAEGLRTALVRHGGDGGAKPGRVASALSVPRSSRRALTGARRPSAPAPSKGSSFFRAWMLVPMVLLLLAAAAIGVGLGVGRLEVGGPLGIQVAGQTPSPAAEVVRVRIVGGQDFDPGGDDGKENGEQVPLAFDGNLGTAWGTEHYETAAFGGLKDGVGLWLRFGRSVRVGRITIVSPIPGWTFDLRAGGSPSDASDPLTSTDGRRSFQVGPSGKVTIELEPTEMPGILVWMTSLAPDEGRFAAKIGEVRVGGTNQ